MAGNFWNSSHFQQWILDKQDLLRQRADDYKAYGEEEYNALMIFFMNYIHALATEPPGPTVRQQVIATACVYFRRFYARRSLKDIDPFLLAPTCLTLAVKVEEYGISFSSKIPNAVNSLGKKMPWLPPESQNIRQMSEAEFYLLEILDCCLIVYHPYRALTQIFQAVKQENNPRMEHVVQDAWRIVNDTLRTDAWILYNPHEIALAAYMAANIEHGNEEASMAWFQDIAVNFENLFDITRMLMNSYKIFPYPDITVPSVAPTLSNLISKRPRPGSGQATKQLAPPPQRSTYSGQQQST